MTFIPSNEYLLEVKKGNVAGAKLVHITARGITAAAWRVIHDITIAGAAVIPQHLTAATLVRVKAGAVNNDAGGSGTRSVTITGLSATGAEQTEVLLTAGTSAGADSANTYIRLFSVRTKDVGTYGIGNVGIVTIEKAAAGLDFLTIGTLLGASLSSMYTVPLGKTGYMLEATMQVGTAGDLRLVCYTRPDILDVTAPYSGKVIEMYQETMAGTLLWQPQGGLKIPALTDIWFESFGSVSTVYATFTMLLIDD